MRHLSPPNPVHHPQSSYATDEEEWRYVPSPPVSQASYSPPRWVINDRWDTTREEMRQEIEYLRRRQDTLMSEMAKMDFHRAEHYPRSSYERESPYSYPSSSTLPVPVPRQRKQETGSEPTRPIPAPRTKRPTATPTTGSPGTDTGHQDQIRDRSSYSYRNTSYLCSSSADGHRSQETPKHRDSTNHRGSHHHDQPEHSPSPPHRERSTSEVLYVDRPAAGRKVLLKLSKVLLRNGDRTIEAFAILDDGLERTIPLHVAAQQLGLKGQPEALTLRTVRQVLQVLHGAAVSFSISPAAEPKRLYHIRGAFTAKQLSLAKHTHPVSALQHKFRHLEGLPLQQIIEAEPLLLIGSDYPHLITPMEPVRLEPPGGPAAIKRHLGWTLQGPAQELCHGFTEQQCLFTSTQPSSVDLHIQVEKLWQMDVLPWRSEKASARSRQDQEAIALLEAKTVRVEVDGVRRYATPLLCIKSMPQLRALKEAVLPQLSSIEKRLVKAPSLQD